jgi:predicted RNase H-like HicB family nuclease
MTEYPILVYYTEEDGGYFAVVPDLPGCSAHGETPEEAVREAQVAQRLWLEVAREIGKPIPAPTRRPALCEAG